jgi:hypothetical protein
VDDEDDQAPFDLLAAVRRNRLRLVLRFVSAAASGQRWLVECRDLGDAFDAAAGVYFVECADDAGVDQVVARCTDDSYDRLLGIFDLRRPLGEQGGGLTRAAWIIGRQPGTGGPGASPDGGGG